MDAKLIVASLPSQAQLDLHGRWWEASLFGSSPAEISADERARGNADVTAESVEHAIEEFGEHVVRHLFGQRRIDAHVGFCRALKRTLHGELIRAMEENRQNDGRGRTVLDTVVVTDGANSVQAVRTRKRYVRSEVVPLLKLAIEIERFEALVTGVLSGDGLRDEPTTVTVDVESFISEMIRDPSDPRFDGSRVEEEHVQYGPTVGGDGVPA